MNRGKGGDTAPFRLICASAYLRLGFLHYGLDSAAPFPHNALISAAFPEQSEMAHDAH